MILPNKIVKIAINHAFRAKTLPKIVSPAIHLKKENFQ